MAKHTPGQWKTSEGADYLDITSSDGNRITGDIMYPDDTDRANAHLIAAAPDLYEFVAGVSNITDIGKSHDEDVRLLTALKDIAGRLLAKAESPNA